jgi:hypothetical protein
MMAALGDIVEPFVSTTLGLESIIDVTIPSKITEEEMDVQNWEAEYTQTTDDE